MAAEKKPAPDWERIEADYRAGLLSLREIASARGVSNVAIHKRAKKEGWERDLGKRIQAKADALVSRREAERATPEAVANDRRIVEANAEAIAGVRLSHRSDIARFRALTISMLGDLEGTTGPGAARIDSLKKLSDTLRTLVTLEREAYGLTADPDGGNDDAPTSLDHFYGAE